MRNPNQNRGPVRDFIEAIEERSIRMVALTDKKDEDSKAPDFPPFTELLVRKQRDTPEGGDPSDHADTVKNKVGTKKYLDEFLPIYFFLQQFHPHTDHFLDLAEAPDASVHDEAGDLIERIEATTVFERNDHRERAEIARGRTEEELWQRFSSPPGFEAFLEECDRVLEKKRSMGYGDKTSLVVMLNTGFVEEEQYIPMICERIVKKTRDHQYDRIAVFTHTGTLLLLLAPNPPLELRGAI